MIYSMDSWLALRAFHDTTPRSWRTPRLESAAHGCRDLRRPQLRPEGLLDFRVTSAPHAVLQGNDARRSAVPPNSANLDLQRRPPLHLDRGLQRRHRHRHLPQKLRHDSVSSATRTPSRSCEGSASLTERRTFPRTRILQPLVDRPLQNHCVALGEAMHQKVWPTSDCSVRPNRPI